MSDIVMGCIGKECNITIGTSPTAQVHGVITEISEGWMTVDNVKDTRIINLGYVSSIQEYPVKKKKKEV